jgi:CspA family cold shock protein
VREQRLRQEKGLPTDPPAFCSDCRGADVRLAEAAGPVLDASADTDVLEAPAAPAAWNRPAQSRNRDQARPRRSGPARDTRGRGRGDGGKKPARAPQTEIRVRHVGSVKYFNLEKGYGFIASEDEGEVFVHLSGMLDPNIRELEIGSPVEFEIEYTSRGPQAVDVIQLA